MHRVNIEKRPIFCVNSISSLFHLSSWSGSNIRWGQAFPPRHLTTGHYLALTETRALSCKTGGKSDTKSTAFSFRASKVRWILTLFSKRKLWNLQVELRLQKNRLEQSRWKLEPVINTLFFYLLNWIREECVPWMKTEVLREKGLNGKWKALKKQKDHGNDSVALGLLENVIVA